MRCGDVLGDIDNDWPGAAGGGDIESLFQGFGKLGQILDKKVMLDTGARDADSIHFLKGIAADSMAWYLTG